MPGSLRVSLWPPQVCAGRPLAVAPVPGVGHGVPGVGEREAGGQVDGRRVAAVGVEDARPAFVGPAAMVRLQPADHVIQLVAAAQQRRGQPVHPVAIAAELVVLRIDALAGLVEHEGVLDQFFGAARQFVFAGDGPPARCTGVGLPGVELQEGVEVVPLAVVIGLDRGVPVPAHEPPAPAQLPPQGRFLGVQAAAEAPAVAVDFLEHGQPARLARIGEMIVAQLHEVVDGNGLFIVGLARLGNRLDDRLEAGAVGGLVGQDLDLGDQSRGLGSSRRRGCGGHGGRGAEDSGHDGPMRHRAG